MQIEKVVDAAVDYRIAKLKAREQGIIGITDCGGKREEFQIYNKDDFQKMLKTREYTVVEHDNEYKYKYRVKVSGLNFICITPFLFKDEDKEFIVTEEEDV